MIEIIPAIIPKSLREMKEKVALIRGLVKTIQIDVMDGLFVPEKSWPYAGEDAYLFKDIVEQKVALPFWHEIDYEIDLMISQPLKTAEEWFEAGVKRIIVHFESGYDWKKPLASLKEKVELGIALNIQTPNEKIYHFIEQFDFVQCMGIERIGYQGEPFSEKVIPKIQDLRKRYSNVIISVDGGVNFESAPRLVRAGANRLVSGSTIWNSPNIKEAIKILALAK